MYATLVRHDSGSFGELRVLTVSRRPAVHKLYSHIPRLTDRSGIPSDHTAVSKY